MKLQLTVVCHHCVINQITIELSALQGAMIPQSMLDAGWLVSPTIDGKLPVSWIDLADKAVDLLVNKDKMVCVLVCSDCVDEAWPPEFVAALRDLAREHNQKFQ